MLALTKPCLPRGHLAECLENITRGLRFASLNTGIAAGIRRGRATDDGKRRSKPNHGPSRNATHPFDFGRGRVSKPRDGKENLREWQYRIKHMAKKKITADHKKYKENLQQKGRVYDRTASKVYVVPPPQIPYTSVASEFIYGSSAVLSAVRCGRRKLHTLYIYAEDQYDFQEDKWGSPEMKSARKFASLAGAVVKHVTGAWKPMLDKMSGGRAHNNIILEASPLPKLPVLSLRSVPSLQAGNFHMNLAPQPAEQAADNGTKDYLPFFQQRSSLTVPQDGSAPPSRYPFILLLDGVLDPGNVGAIIRSAHFFGVDAIAFSSRNSAPLTSVTLKAAAGAAEVVPLLTVRNASDFIRDSKANGWRFFVADTPNAIENHQQIKPNKSTPVLAPHQLSSELGSKPCVLVIGGEERGVSGSIKNQVDAFASIPGVFSGNSDDDPAAVDSLNVSVASALLSSSFLASYFGGSTTQSPRAPQAKTTTREGENDSRVF